MPSCLSFTGYLDILVSFPRSLGVRFQVSPVVGFLIVVESSSIYEINRRKDCSEDYPVIHLVT